MSSAMIICDPTFTENTNCNCFRCERRREQHGICDAAMGVYDNWRIKAGIDERQHQLEGIKWCLYHELCPRPHGQVRGGIIADEMGLGKTIIMLACIRCNFLEQTLIVLPPALVSQWVDIFQRFLGHAPFIYHDSKAKSITIEELKNKPIVITTYGMITMRFNEKKEPLPNKLHKIQWNRVIYDEAHHLRNMDTGRHKGACAIQAHITWVVTGTPINNCMSDLFALCKIIGISNMFEPKKEVIKTLLGIHMLRRTKLQVGIKLPPVHENIIHVDWESTAEFEMAADIHSCMHLTGVTRENVNELITWLNRHPLPALTRSRQICIYPRLLHKAVKKMKEGGIIPEAGNLADIRTSSKITAIVDCVASKATNGRRKLIFSHYRGEIDILAERLQAAGLTCQTIDGRTSKRERRHAILPVINQGGFHSVCKRWNGFPRELCNIINEYIAPQVMIMQIQTACEGLNMQHFQEIYFTSPHWNPAVEDQAIARAHRIGQDQSVDVYKFVMAGFGKASISFEQYCLNVQNAKRDIMQIIN